jgi:hypothetical protein
VGFLDINDTFDSDMGYAKATKMYKHDSKATLRRRIENLDSTAARLQAKLDLMEAIPEEPDGEVNVLYFEKHFGDGKTYTYAAVRVKENGLWYTTGPSSPKGYTWEQLWVWMHDKGGVPSGVWLASEMVELES